MLNTLFFTPTKRIDLSVLEGKGGGKQGESREVIDY